MSLFDDIQQTVFSTTQTVFGDTAVWTSTETQVVLSEKVLFNCPTQPISIGQNDKYEYRPYDYFFEYTQSQFPNLKQLSDAGTVQTVTVKGYVLNVREVRTKFDGQTFIAYCELTPEDTNSTN